VKFPGEAAERVASVLLTRGAASVSELATELRLSPQAIRRSLSGLETAGMVQSHERAPFGPAPAKRRGRPSSSYSLTVKGRNAFDQSYDDLALESLQFIERNFGRENVRAFASERAHRIVKGTTIPEIVASLNTAGFEATFESTNLSGQLCQHHCPVIDAARAYPELCEEETRVLGEALGGHPTRLATLAQGHAICTTLIPLNPASTKASHHTKKVNHTLKEEVSA
jgi:predicted ArsR family transcriptional regulator